MKIYARRGRHFSPRKLPTAGPDQTSRLTKSLLLLLHLHQLREGRMAPRNRVMGILGIKIIGEYQGRHLDTALMGVLEEVARKVHRQYARSPVHSPVPSHRSSQRWRTSRHTYSVDWHAPLLTVEELVATDLRSGRLMLHSGRRVPRAAKGCPHS